MWLEKKAEVYLIFAAFLWGGTFVAIKLAVTDISPIDFLMYRFGLAFLTSCLLFSKKVLFPTDILIWKGSFLVGLVAFFGYILQTEGLVLTSATKSGFITGTYVIFLPFIQRISGGAFPKTRVWFSICFVLLGLFWISGGDLGNGWNAGDSMTLGCAFAFAVYILCMDKYSKTMIPEQMTTWHVFWMLLFVMVWKGNAALPIPETNTIWAIFYTALPATILTSWIQSKYQSLVSPTRAGILFSLEPVFSFVLAFFLLGETLPAIGLLGCLTILIGVYLAES